MSDRAGSEASDGRSYADESARLDVIASATLATSVTAKAGAAALAVAVQDGLGHALLIVATVVLGVHRRWRKHLRRFAPSGG